MDQVSEAYMPLSAETLDETERQALTAAVAQTRTDSRPDVPHEEVQAEILAEIEALERRLASPAV